jgi:hypothetical protein
MSAESPGANCRDCSVVATIKRRAGAESARRGISRSLSAPCFMICCHGSRLAHAMFNRKRGAEAHRRGKRAHEHHAVKTLNFRPGHWRDINRAQAFILPALQMQRTVLLLMLGATVRRIAMKVQRRPQRNLAATTIRLPPLLFGKISTHCYRLSARSNTVCMSENRFGFDRGPPYRNGRTPVGSMPQWSRDFQC